MVSISAGFYELITSEVRADKRMENVEVARCMLEHPQRVVDRGKVGKISESSDGSEFYTKQW